MIGQLNENVKEKIPLKPAKPRFVRSQFRDQNRPRDVLGVNEKIQSALVALMDDGKLVFSDVASAPNSCVLYGRYEQGENGLSVDVRLKYDTEERFQKRIEKASEVDLWKELAAEVVIYCPVTDHH